MACGGSGRTYGASLPGLLPGVAATFAIAELDGSATKKIRLLKMVVSGSELTAIAVNDLRLTKMSSISTGGTATTGVATPFDTAFPAPTAVFRGFTVAPTGRRRGSRSDCGTETFASADRHQPGNGSHIRFPVIAGQRSTDSSYGGRGVRSRLQRRDSGQCAEPRYLRLVDRGTAERLRTGQPAAALATETGA